MSDESEENAMKKLLQFTSIFVCTLLLCFYITPMNVKADRSDPVTSGIELHSGQAASEKAEYGRQPEEIAGLCKANVTAASRETTVNTSSGINTQQEYVITFNSNYGTLIGSSRQTTVNQKLTSLPIALRDGYTFRGWYTQSAGGDRVTTSMIFYSDTNVYAQWDNYELNFRDILVFNNSDTSVTITAIIPNTYIRNWGVSYGTANNYLSLARDTNLYSSTASLTTTLTGLSPNTTYFFKVYYIADTIRIESSIRSFTTARSAEYNVTFYPNGGTVSGQSTISTVNLKIPYLPSAYREGYNFDGWYSEPYGGTMVTADTVFRSNSTVYAHWTYAQNSSTSNPAVTNPGSGTVNNGNTNNGIANNGNTNNSSSSSNTDPDYYDEPISVQKVKLKKVTNKPVRKIKVKWTWYAYGDGYQIAYSTKKNFDAKKTKRISAGVFTDSKTIAGLTKGKTYYVRVRAFQKAGGKKYYGAWSNVKKIKIKK